MNKKAGGNSYGLVPYRPWEGFGCSECDGNFCMDLGREETHSIYFGCYAEKYIPGWQWWKEKDHSRGYCKNQARNGSNLM